MREIQADELEALATGAWILGAGGGGNPYLTHLNLRRLYEQGVRVSLMDPMELADDALVATCASMGAPLVGRERMSVVATSIVLGQLVTTGAVLALVRGAAGILWVPVARAAGDFARVSLIARRFAKKTPT